MTSTVKVSEDVYILFCPMEPVEILTKTELTLRNKKAPIGSWLYVAYMDEWLVRGVIKHPYPSWLSKEVSDVPEQYRLQTLLLKS